jgi:hypothetical protein
MQLTSKKTCGRKTHKVQVTVYDFETIEQVIGASTFLFEGSTKEIARLVDQLGASNKSNPNARICRQACCQTAAAATGLKDVEEIVYE